MIIDLPYNRKINRGVYTLSSYKDSIHNEEHFLLFKNAYLLHSKDLFNKAYMSKSGTRTLDEFIEDEFMRIMEDDG